MKEMQSTIEAQQSIIQSQQARMEYLLSQMHAIGGPNGPVAAPPPTATAFEVCKFCLLLFGCGLIFRVYL